MKWTPPLPDSSAHGLTSQTRISIIVTAVPGLVSVPVRASVSVRPRPNYQSLILLTMKICWCVARHGASCLKLLSHQHGYWIMNMAWKQSFYRLKLWIIKPSAARIAKTNHSSYYSFIDIWHFNVAVRESVCVRRRLTYWKEERCFCYVMLVKIFFRIYP